MKIIPEKAREVCLDEAERSDLAALVADLQIWEFISELFRERVKKIVKL